MTSITKIINDIDTIRNPVKNGYVACDDLDILIINLDSLLKSAVNAKNRMILSPHYSLDVLFPAIEHLRLFLNSEDLGAIALVSKTLYNLMVLNFTQLQTEIFILEHYVANYVYFKSYANIDFIVNNQKITIPLNIRMIKFKQIRMLIGFEKYQQLYGRNPHRFFKDDFIISMIQNDEIGYYQTILCIFCEKPNLCYEDHKNCAIDYQKISPIKCQNFENIKSGKHYTLSINYLHPELEYLAIQHLKENMPNAMKITCKGKYYDGYNQTCFKCSMFKHVHTLYK